MTRPPNFDLSTRARDGAVDTCTKVRPSTGRLPDPVTHIWPGFWVYYCWTGRPRSGLYGQKVNDSKLVATRSSDLASLGQRRSRPRDRREGGRPAAYLTATEHAGLNHGMSSPPVSPPPTQV